MTVILLVALAVIFFILGAFFLMHAFQPPEPEQAQAVSLAEFHGSGIRTDVRIEPSGETSPAPEEIRQQATVPADPDASLKEENRELLLRVRQLEDALQRELKSKPIESTSSVDDAAYQQLKSKMQDQMKQNECLRDERDQLQIRLDEVGQIEKRISAIATRYTALTAEYDETRKTVQQLKDDKSAMQLRYERLTQMRHSPANAEGEISESSKITSSVQDADLQRQVTKLKELNTTLLEKERILQYELAKNRSQVAGLERICEGFRLHIDKIPSSHP